MEIHQFIVSFLLKSEKLRNLMPLDRCHGIQPVTKQRAKDLRMKNAARLTELATIGKI